MRQRRRSSRLSAPCVLATGSAAASARRNAATKCGVEPRSVDLDHLGDALVVVWRPGRHDGARPIVRNSRSPAARGGVARQDRQRPARSSSPSVTSGRGGPTPPPGTRQPGTDSPVQPGQPLVDRHQLVGPCRDRLCRRRYRDGAGRCCRRRGQACDPRHRRIGRAPAVVEEPRSASPSSRCQAANSRGTSAGSATRTGRPSGPVAGRDAVAAQHPHVHRLRRLLRAGDGVGRSDPGRQRDRPRAAPRTARAPPARARRTGDAPRPAATPPRRPLRAPAASPRRAAPRPARRHRGSGVPNSPPRRRPPARRRATRWRVDGGTTHTTASTRLRPSGSRASAASRRSGSRTRVQRVVAQLRRSDGPGHVRVELLPEQLARGRRTGRRRRRAASPRPHAGSARSAARRRSTSSARRRRRRRTVRRSVNRGSSEASTRARNCRGVRSSRTADHVAARAPALRSARRRALCVPVVVRPAVASWSPFPVPTSHSSTSAHENTGLAPPPTGFGNSA